MPVITRLMSKKGINTDDLGETSTKQAKIAKMTIEGASAVPVKTELVSRFSQLCFEKKIEFILSLKVRFAVWAKYYGVCISIGMVGNRPVTTITPPHPHVILLSSYNIEITSQECFLDTEKYFKFLENKFKDPCFTLYGNIDDDSVVNFMKKLDEIFEEYNEQIISDTQDVNDQAENETEDLFEMQLDDAAEESIYEEFSDKKLTCGHDHKRKNFEQHKYYCIQDEHYEGPTIKFNDLAKENCREVLDFTEQKCDLLIKIDAAIKEQMIDWSALKALINDKENYIGEFVRGYECSEEWREEFYFKKDIDLQQYFDQYQQIFDSGSWKSCVTLKEMAGSVVRNAIAKKEDIQELSIPTSLKEFLVAKVQISSCLNMETFIYNDYFLFDSAYFLFIIMNMYLTQ